MGLLRYCDASVNTLRGRYCTQKGKKVYSEVKKVTLKAKKEGALKGKRG